MLLTDEEREKRRALLNALIPVFEMLGGKVAGAYTYSELCEEVSVMLTREWRRVRPSNMESGKAARSEGWAKP